MGGADFSDLDLVHDLMRIGVYQIGKGSSKLSTCSVVSFF